MDEARVTLRAFTVDDLPEFLEWAMDDDVTKFLMWESYTSSDEALNWLRTRAVPHPWIKAVCVDGKAAGSIEVGRSELEAATPGLMTTTTTGTIGYCLAKKHWGNGVGTIAVQKMVALVFQGMPDMKCVEAVVDQRNTASRRVLEKAGFTLRSSLPKHMKVKDKLIDCFVFAIDAASPDHSN